MQTPYQYDNNQQHFLYHWSVGLILIILCSVLLYIGPLEAPDTMGYLNFSDIRQPLACYFFNFFKIIFGYQYYWAIFITQLILGIVACGYASHVFNHIFQIERIASIFTFFILLAPYFLPTRFANFILSEGLSYPLFIMALSMLAQSLAKQSFKYYLGFLGVIVLLVLTRRQFIFLYPFLVLFITYQLWRRPIDVQPLNIILCSILAVSAAEFLDMLYYHVNWGIWMHAPFTWRQACVAMFYLSQPEDVQLFTDPLVAQVFNTTRQTMLTENIGFDPTTIGKLPREFIYYQNFYLYYNVICHRILGPVLNNINVINNIDREGILKSITLILLKKHYLNFLILYIFNIVKNLGSYLFTLQLVVIALWAAFAMKHRNIALYIQITFWIGILNLGNYMTIALVEPVLDRYTMYTNVPQTAILIILIIKGLSNPSLLFQSQAMSQRCIRQ